VINDKVWTKVRNQLIFNYHGLKAVVKEYFCQIIWYNHGLQAVVNRSFSMGALALIFLINL
jgi:hypothetical protein